MQKRYFYAIGLIIVTLLVAFTAYFASYELLFHHQKHHVPHTAPYDFHQYLHRQLDVTTEQDQQIAGLEKQYIQQRLLLEQRIQDANHQLVAILNQQPNYNNAVQLAIGDVHAAQGALQELTIQHVYDVRGLLNEKQASALDKFVAEALLQGTPRNLKP